MPSTLLIFDNTVKLLKLVIEREGLNSYDEAILWLIWAGEVTIKSMFGSIKGMRWTKEDRFDILED